jgi:hypothetical protein
MTAILTSSHQETYDALFRHPVAHNVHWRDVRAMLGQLGEVVEEHNGNLKVTWEGRSIVLHPAADAKMLDLEDLLQVRRFLAPHGKEPSLAPVPVETKGMHLLVVIDHREARVYQTDLQGTVPQRITPYDPFGYGRNLHYVQDDFNGQRKPELKSFYEAIARTLQGAQKILVFGSATGASSAMTQLLVELRHNHHELAAHIVAEIVVDQQHLSENELLAAARAFYAKQD